MSVMARALPAGDMAATDVDSNGEAGGRAPGPVAPLGDASLDKEGGCGPSPFPLPDVHSKLLIFT